MQTSGRACGRAFTTANALGRAGDLLNQKPRRACLLTGAAGYAVFLLPVDLYQAETVEPAVNRSQRAKILAKRPENLYRKQENKKQDSKLPEKQTADLASQCFIGRKQRKCAKKRTGRTKVFTERRYFCKAAKQKHGSDAHKQSKYCIFSVF